MVPSEWLYFLSGAVVPTLAYVLLLSKHSSSSSPSPAPSSTGATKSTRKASPVQDRSHAEGDPDGGESSGEDDDDDDEGDSSDDDAPATASSPLACSSWGYQHAPYKMMLVVNQELNMGKGKIAAQCGHASVGCYKRCLRACPRGLRAWERTGCAKIAVKCPTTVELEEIAAVALSLGIPAYLVEDAGRTQIAAGSRTVLGLFGPAFAFDGVTDHLKLM